MARNVRYGVSRQHPAAQRRSRRAAPAAATAVPTGVPGAWTPVFFDEFAGSTLDTTKWSKGWFPASTDATTSPVGGTNEDAFYEAGQVAVSGGNLSITMVAKTQTIGGVTKNWATGLVTTNGLVEMTYGAVEARMYVAPGTDGKPINWPAFWMDGHSWPATGELDVMEGLDGNIGAHFHYDGGGGTNAGPGFVVSGNYSGWHTYGAVWDAGVVTYYYDGIEVGLISEGITSAPMYLILGFGPRTTGSVAGTMLVDYVRTWQRTGATPAFAPVADTFSSGTVPSPTLWQIGTQPGSAVVSGGRMVITSGASTYTQGPVALLSGMVPASDVDLSLDVGTDATEQYITVSARVDRFLDSGSQPYPDNGYYVELQPAASQFIVGRSRDGSRTTLGTYAYTFSSSVRAGVRLRLTGSLVQVRLWDLPAAEPTTWLHNATDATPLLYAGKVLLVSGNGNNAARAVSWDNVAVAATVAGATYTQTPADAEPATDTVSTAVAAVRAAADAAAAADATTTGVDAVRAVTDVGAGSDSAATLTVGDRAAGDVATLADSVSASLSVVASSNPADAAALVDAAALTVTAERATNDNAAGTDAILSVVAASPTVADPAAGADTASSPLDASRAAADAISGSDTVVVQANVSPGVSDGVAGSDSLTAQMAAVRVADDTAAGSDAATAQSNMAAQASDTAAGSDSPAFQVSAVVSPADAATGSDVVSLATSRAISDAASVADAFTVTQVVSVAFADAAALADLVSPAQAGAANQTAGDSAVGADSATVTQTKTLVVADSAAGADQAVLGVSRTAADAAALADQPATAQAVVRAVSDLAALTDVATPAAAGATDLAPSDAAQIADAVTVALQRIVTVDDLLAAIDGTTVARAVSAADTAGLVDDATAASRLGSVTIADDAGIADAVTVALQRVVTVADLLDAIDSAVPTLGGDLHDYTFTGQLDQRAWAGSVSDRAWAGSLNDRTWEGMLSDV